MTLKPDDIFIYPTDTVWGIGSSIYSEKGHERIADIKKTAKNKPLSIMFASAEDILSSFKLPEEMTKEWLETFFSMETTLGLPLALSKIRIPRWATGESSYVSLRCLSLPVVSKIHQDLQAPFFSTSLNLTGEAPITSLEEARNFYQQHAPDAIFFPGEHSGQLSGTSSSIVFINENLTFEIKREGRKVEEVKEHLMRLFC